MNTNTKVDYKKLPSDLQDKLRGWEQNSPTHKSLQTLKGIESLLDSIKADLGKQSDEPTHKLLQSIQRELEAIKNKETAETPDHATPVVEAVNKLEAAVKALEVKPEFKPEVHVPTPKVTVEPAKVDIDVASLVKATDEVKKAVKAIKFPEQEKVDFQPVLQALEEMSTQLSSIDTASRMKPTFPNTLKVTNTDGTAIAYSKPSDQYAIDDIDKASDPKYFGYTAIDGRWYIMRITGSANVDYSAGAADYTTSWTGRAGLTYGNYADVF